MTTEYIVEIVSLMKPTIFGTLNKEAVPIYVGIPVKVELTPEIASRIEERNLEKLSMELIRHPAVGEPVQQEAPVNTPKKKA